MWKTIYIAHTEEQAKNKANADGKRLLVQLKSAGGKHNKAYEICLPVSEAEDAYEVLCENKFQY